jgi:hypothetical protein
MTGDKNVMDERKTNGAGYLAWQKTPASKEAGYSKVPNLTM